MKPRLALLALVLLVAGVGVNVSGVFSADPPDPQATEHYQCNTCDARQQAKQRLREKLKAAESAGE